MKQTAWTISLFMLLLVSCKSGKMALRDGNMLRLTGEEQLEAVIMNTPVFDSFSSQLRIGLPSKKSDLTLNGTLRMQHEKLIRISLLLPVLRTEVARIEISPESILVIDRMNKRYASVPVAELREVLHTEVDFRMLQSLFSNAIFLPGRESLSRKDYSSFQAEPHGRDSVRLSRKSREFVYSFLTSQETNRLVSSAIETHSSAYRIQWEYRDFVPVGVTTFPSEMTVFVGKAEAPERITLALSRLSVDRQTLSPTAIPGRYEQIRLSDILKMLEGL